jgi:uncharacterized BrkB/YihY/UPF0761 family membrane protein
MTQPDPPQKSPWRKALKALLLTFVILLGFVVLAFGLVVGFCALSFGRH